ncbi:MAG: hypothetical protein SFX72_16605 [Isosphaeraceae bacterium]|nr:hypothetical protein [Isosphaeraceae bacterium]
MLRHSLLQRIADRGSATPQPPNRGRAGTAAGSYGSSDAATLGPSSDSIDSRRAEWVELLNPTNALTRAVVEMAFDAHLRYETVHTADNALARMRLREASELLEQELRNRAVEAHRAYLADPVSGYEAHLATRDGSYDILRTAESLLAAWSCRDWGPEENRTLRRVEGASPETPEPELEHLVDLFDAKRNLQRVIADARLDSDHRHMIEGWKLELADFERSVERGRAMIRERLDRVIERARTANAAAHARDAAERRLRLDAALVDDSPHGLARHRILRDSMIDTYRAIEYAAVVAGEPPAPAASPTADRPLEDSVDLEDRSDSAGSDPSATVIAIPSFEPLDPPAPNEPMAESDDFNDRLMLLDVRRRPEVPAPNEPMEESDDSNDSPVMHDDRRRPEVSAPNEPKENLAGRRIRHARADRSGSTVARFRPPARSLQLIAPNEPKEEGANLEDSSGWDDESEPRRDAPRTGRALVLFD